MPAVLFNQFGLHRTQTRPLSVRTRAIVRPSATVVAAMTPVVTYFPVKGEGYLRSELPACAVCAKRP